MIEEYKSFINSRRLSHQAFKYYNNKIYIKYKDNRFWFSGVSYISLFDAELVAFNKVNLSNVSRETFYKYQKAVENKHADIIDFGFSLVKESEERLLFSISTTAKGEIELTIIGNDYSLVLCNKEGTPVNRLCDGSAEVVLNYLKNSSFVKFLLGR